MRARFCAAERRPSAAFRHNPFPPPLPSYQEPDSLPRAPFACFPGCSAPGQAPSLHVVLTPGPRRPRTRPALHAHPAAPTTCTKRLHPSPIPPRARRAAPSKPPAPRSAHLKQQLQTPCTRAAACNRHARPRHHPQPPHALKARALRRARLGLCEVYCGRARRLQARAPERRRRAVAGGSFMFKLAAAEGGRRAWVLERLWQGCMQAVACARAPRGSAGSGGYVTRGQVCVDGATNRGPQTGAPGVPRARVEKTKQIGGADGSPARRAARAVHAARSMRARGSQQAARPGARRQRGPGPHRLRPQGSRQRASATGSCTHDRNRP